jgi:AcrR family transcriptional regulator
MAMPLLGKTKQQVLSEFRSSEILEAARQVFAKKGFNEATVDEIAEAAEVAKGTLYLYFPSKHEMYLAALRQGIEGLYELTKERLGTAATTKDKFQTFVETRITYFDENRDFFKIYYSELGNIFCDPNGIPKNVRDLYTKQVRLLERILQDGMVCGDLRPIPAGAAANAIYDLIRGLIARRLLAPSKASASGDLVFLLDLIWKGIEKR